MRHITPRRSLLTGRSGLLALSLGAVCLAGLGGALPARAQDDLPNYEESVVVTASAVEQQRDESPAAATVITAAEIADRQYPLLSDLLATVPGVGVVSAGPTGQQTSLFVRGAESDQTLLLWNGISLNSPYFGAVNWQFVPTEGIERVEVVRGPFSALWGGNAIGGVVQVLSGSRNGGAVQLEGGEDGFFRSGLAAGYGFGKLRFDVTSEVRRGDGVVDNAFFDSEDLAVKLGWQPSEHTSLGVLARLDDSDTGIPYSNGQPNTTAHIAWKEREVAVPFATAFGDWKIDAQVSHIESDYTFRDPLDPFGFTASDTDAEANRGRVVAAYSPNAALRVAVGAEVERVEATDSSSFGVNFDGADQRTWAAFGELGYTLDRLTIDVGVRRDDNDIYGAETSLRAGASWRLTEELRLKASYGEAFRPPTLGELFFPGSGNTQLEPERGESYEAGFTFATGDFRSEITAFELDQKNVIDFDPVSFTFANIDRARSRGLEGSFSWSSPRTRLSLAATYLDTENLDTGERLLRRPRFQASATLTEKVGSRLALTGVARYVGSRPDGDPITFSTRDNPSYVRFDAGAKWKANGWLSPFARVENLADREYAEVLGYPAAGRTFFGGIALGF